MQSQSKRMKMKNSSTRNSRISSLLTWRISETVISTKENPSMTPAPAHIEANYSESENLLWRIINTFTKSTHTKASSNSFSPRTNIPNPLTKYFLWIFSILKTSKKYHRRMSHGTWRRTFITSQLNLATRERSIDISSDATLKTQWENGFKHWRAHLRSGTQ